MCQTKRSHVTAFLFVLRFGGDTGLGHFSKNAVRNTSGFAIQKPRKLQRRCKRTVLTVAVIELLC